MREAIKISNLLDESISQRYLPLKNTCNITRSEFANKRTASIQLPRLIDDH